MPPESNSRIPLKESILVDLTYQSWALGHSGWQTDHRAEVLLLTRISLSSWPPQKPASRKCFDRAEGSVELTVESLFVVEIVIPQPGEPRAEQAPRHQPNYKPIRFDGHFKHSFSFA